MALSNDAEVVCQNNSCYHFRPSINDMLLQLCSHWEENQAMAATSARHLVGQTEVVGLTALSIVASAIKV